MYQRLLRRFLTHLCDVALDAGHEGLVGLGEELVGVVKIRLAGSLCVGGRESRPSMDMHTRDGWTWSVSQSSRGHQQACTRTHISSLHTTHPPTSRTVTGESFSSSCSCVRSKNVHPVVLRAVRACVFSPWTRNEDGDVRRRCSSHSHQGVSVRWRPPLQMHTPSPPPALHFTYLSKPKQALLM